MRHMAAMLRVGRSGVVLGLDAEAADWLGPVAGARCCDVVLAREGQRTVCDPTCAARALDGGAPDRDRLVTVRGRPHRLSCVPVGDEVVVVLRPASAAAPLLTPREREILGLVARGWATARIGRTLDVRESTVRTHLERARDKLGARTRAEAVARALAAHLLDDVG